MNQRPTVRSVPYLISFSDHLDYVAELVRENGPSSEQYDQHLAWYSQLNRQIESGEITEPQRNRIRDAFGPGYTHLTLQGYVYQWPLGYAGDYRILERIYSRYVSPDPKFRRYDEFFQSQLAPQAVRNRKLYFQRLVKQLSEQRKSPLMVLNLASGPCREIRDLLDEFPALPVHFVCVEQDKLAIQHAKVVVGRHADKVTFVNQNVFRYKPSQPFSLIWSAGLFDYFDDRTFFRVVRRFLRYLDDGGELVVGNFGWRNSTKGYMEAIGKWYLNHRSDALLCELAERAGVTEEHRLNVGAEPTGVNRFLHIAQANQPHRIDLAHDQLKTHWNQNSGVLP